MGLKQEIRTNRMILSFILVIMVALSVTFIISVVNPLDYFKSTPELTASDSKIVYFDREDVNILNSRVKSDINEFVYCLYGRNYKKGYKIERIAETKVINSDETSITYYPCGKSLDFLGTIHLHPSGMCRLSGQDIYTFGATDSILTGVICGIDKIAMYDKIDFYKPYLLIIEEENDG